MIMDLFYHFITTAQGFEGVLSAYGTLRGSLFNIDKLTSWIIDVVPSQCMQSFLNEITRREKKANDHDISSESENSELPARGFLSRIAE